MSSQSPKALPTQRNPWLVLIFMCLGFFMILLDTTIVNVAIPKMLTGLGSSLDQMLWVLNSYILVYAVLLITAGRLGDLWGPRQLFTVGLIIFTVASAICGAAQNTNQLIAARVVQGVGGALLTPQTLSIITAIFPPERRGAAFGIWGSVAGLATITGPTLGGFLVTYIDWRWIFYVNVPVGVVAIAGSIFIIPDLRHGLRHRFDLVGVALSSLGLFGIVFGLVEGERYSWGTVTGFVTIPEMLAGGVLLFIAFLVWEKFQAEPLVPLDLFRDRNYAICSWISAVVAFGMLGLFLPLTIFLQSVLGMSALQAGLTFLPMTVVSSLIAPFVGRQVDRVGGKWILMAGLSFFAIGMGLVARQAEVDSTWQTFFFPTVIAGLGMGMTFAPLITTAMREIRPQRAGAASGVMNTTRQLGGALGSAVVGAVLQNRLSADLHTEAVARSLALPVSFRQRIVDAFSNAAHSGFQVGAGQTGGFRPPPGVPAQVAAQLQQIGAQIFDHAYLSAMKPALAVGIAVLAVGAVSAIGLAGHRRPDASAPKVAVAAPEREEATVA